MTSTPPFAVIASVSEAIQFFPRRHSGSGPEPVIGPRFARTRWDHPKMTKRLDCFVVSLLAMTV
jgi:hypothetical protein